MKFVFTSQFQGFGSPKNTLEFESDQLADVVEYFEQFLRGAGYHFDGHLDLCHITEPVKQDDCNRCESVACNGCICESEDNVVLAEPPLKYKEGMCKICGLTRDQLGSYNCYDTKCGLK